MALAPPRPIDDGCNLAPFGSGVPLLDEWLKCRARANHLSVASRVYIACEARTVIAF
jgi:hypothetical protein